MPTIIAEFVISWRRDKKILKRTAMNIKKASLILGIFVKSCIPAPNHSSSLDQRGSCITPDRLAVTGLCDKSEADRLPNVEWLTLTDYRPAVYRQLLLFGAVGHVRQRRRDSLSGFNRVPVSAVNMTGAASLPNGNSTGKLKLNARALPALLYRHLTGLSGLQLILNKVGAKMFIFMLCSEFARGALPRPPVAVEETSGEV
ncbi:hypothetical protein J6590_019936 [Homalodisca vitripennis]|nr:hypothetical protein J6590_019936 [Homalodisca vitripennis]